MRFVCHMAICFAVLVIGGSSLWASAEAEGDNRLPSPRQEPMPHEETSLGPCGPGCPCGCAQGKPCTCHRPAQSPPQSSEQPEAPPEAVEEPSEKPFKGPCGPDCPCGCAQGKPCTCHRPVQSPTQSPEQPEMPSEAIKVPSETPYKRPCGPDCPCGCVQGGPCSCDQNEAFQDQEEDRFADPNEKMTSFMIECHCDETIRPSHVDPDISMNEPCGSCGTWLPEDPLLFRPFMADPREVDYSAGWRFNDNALTKNIIDVSFGDTFVLYRFCDVWPWHGDLQFELEGAVWATFDPSTESAPLMNADYYVGVPISYAIEHWQFRFRGYHISSHLGDEFLLNHPGFDRRNASAEYVDFFISHDLTEEIRLYGGLGYVVQQDEEFKTKRFYSALGAELRLLSIGFLDPKDMLYGCPIFAMHFRQNGEFKHHVDATYILGYEFGKLCGLYRKLRFFMEYHDGYSVEGQYFKIPTNYFSLRMSYGF